jgi:hypothetical protein
MTYQDLAQIEAGMVSLCTRARKENTPVSVMHISGSDESGIASILQMIEADNISKLFRTGSECVMFIPQCTQKDVTEIVGTFKSISPELVISYQGYDPKAVSGSCFYHGGDRQVPFDIEDFFRKKQE